MDRTLACGAGNVGSIPTESTDERHANLVRMSEAVRIGKPVGLIESTDKVR